MNNINKERGLEVTGESKKFQRRRLCDGKWASDRLYLPHNIDKAIHTRERKRFRLVLGWDLIRVYPHIYRNFVCVRGKVGDITYVVMWCTLDLFIGFGALLVPQSLTSLAVPPLLAIPSYLLSHFSIAYSLVIKDIVSFITASQLYC